MKSETIISEKKTVNKNLKKLMPVCGLLLLLVFSESVYLALLQLDAVNGLQPVMTFWLEMGSLFIFYALAAYLVLRFQSNRKVALFIVIFGAILFRVSLLPAGIPSDFTVAEKVEALKADLSGDEVTYERFQLFDNDIWRYLWDGHVGANGLNPYQYAPSDEKLDFIEGDSNIGNGEISNDDATESETDDETLNEISEESSAENPSNGENQLWQNIRENVNYPNVTTIYPPFAQLVFRLSHAIAPGSLLMMKILLVVCELIGILFLGLSLKKLEMPFSCIILYAWNPLMIKVFAGSGHADSILVMMLCAMTYFLIIGAKSLTSITFALAILAKISPIFLLPFIVRRVGWSRSVLIFAVVLIGYLPFIDARENLFAGFLKFAREWQFNAGVFGLIRWIAGSFAVDSADFARKVCVLLIFLTVVWLVRRDDLTPKSFIKSAAIVLGAIVILSPTVMPWYLSWVLPFAVMARQYVWIYLSAFVLVAFHIMIDGREYATFLMIEHGLFFALIFATKFQRKLKQFETSGLGKFEANLS